MNKGFLFGSGLGLGTAVMFLLDPNRGKRRRALIRDKVVWATRKTGEGLDAAAKDLNNRVQGIAHEVQSKFSSAPVTDDVLVDRVRAKLGRVVSHPGAVEVTAQNGVVTLAGPILQSEVSDLLNCVEAVRGLQEVHNKLDAHHESDQHPALQGGRQRPGQRSEFFQENWSPAARLLAGAAGASLAAYGGVRRSALGAGLGAAGLLLLARGITNVGLKEMAGFQREPKGDLQQQSAMM
jgi:gas vesicle protein